MTLNIQSTASLPGATSLTIEPDVEQYARVTVDGGLAGTYSLLVVPETGWDDAAVKAATLAWFNAVEES